jgi:hypothetical protein
MCDVTCANGSYGGVRPSRPSPRLAIAERRQPRVRDATPREQRRLFEAEGWQPDGEAGTPILCSHHGNGKRLAHLALAEPCEPSAGSERVQADYPPRKPNRDREDGGAPAKQKPNYTPPDAHGLCRPYRGVARSRVGQIGCGPTRARSFAREDWNEVFADQAVTDILGRGHAAASCCASGLYVAMKRRTLASVSGHMRRPSLSRFFTNDLSFMAFSPNCQIDRP